MIFIKKIIVLLTIVSLFYLTTAKEEVIIPNDAIRFRIIASSNSVSDQLTKQYIKEDILKQVMPKFTNTSNIDASISESIPYIKQILNSHNVAYTISYGQNYFPMKKYKGVTYKPGYYNSLVITLGQGQGENFWCIMYPPLCLIDNKNMNDIEYKSFIKETLMKYTNND